MTYMQNDTVQVSRKARRTWRTALIALCGAGALFSVLGLAAARAVAEEGAEGVPFMHGRRAAFMKHMVSAKLDAALSAAQVTPRQREAIHGVRDRLFGEMQKARQELRQKRGADLDQALQLFTADRLDRERLGALRQKHEVAARRMADAVEGAIVEVHGILTPAQRKAMADYIAQHVKAHPRFGGKGQGQGQAQE